MNMETKLNEGDLVWVVADEASHIVKNKKIASRAVVIRKIPNSIWYRVFMSWTDKTKIVELPAYMLRKVDEK